jgi:hypothetical protein
VPLVKAAELRITLYQHFDVFLLVLEHQPTSSYSLRHESTVRRTSSADGRGFAGITGEQSRRVERAAGGDRPHRSPSGEKSDWLCAMAAVMSSTYRRATTGMALRDYLTLLL